MMPNMELMNVPQINTVRRPYLKGREVFRELVFLNRKNLERSCKVWKRALNREIWRFLREFGKFLKILGKFGKSFKKFGKFLFLNFSKIIKIIL